MSDNSWLKKSDAKNIASYVRDYGPLALCYNGLSEMDNATIASKTILSLSNESMKLQAFFEARHKGDDIESIKYEVYEFNPAMRYVFIERITTFKFDGKVERQNGPLVDRKLATQFVEMLNAFNFNYED